MPIRLLAAASVLDLETQVAAVRWSCPEPEHFNLSVAWDTCFCGCKYVAIAVQNFVLLTEDEYMQLLARRNAARRQKEG